MKTILFLIALNVGLSSCSGKTTDESKTMNSKKELASILDSSLLSITEMHDTSSLKNSLSNTPSKAVYMAQTQVGAFQETIDHTINQCFETKSIAPIERKINEIESNSEIPKQYKAYWKIYLLYYTSIIDKKIFHDDDKASKSIDKAIEAAERGLKTAEENALYAMCLSYSIQFSNMTKLNSIASKVSEYGQKALQLDPFNVRAYYVLTSQNFYTPKMFGGMTKVEEYGIKGISCPSQSANDPYSPTWGKPELYSLLINFYKAENRPDDLSKIKELANREFPNRFEN